MSARLISPPAWLITDGKKKGYFALPGGAFALLDANEHSKKIGWRQNGFPELNVVRGKSTPPSILIVLLKRIAGGMNRRAKTGGQEGSAGGAFSTNYNVDQPIKT
jgi:hypothetical protein